MCIINNCREMYQAKRYHHDFAAPMAAIDGIHVVVNDFIVFYHEILGERMGKVIKFFKKVLNYII